MVQCISITTNDMLMIINDRKGSAIIMLIEKFLGASVFQLAYRDPSDKPTGFHLLAIFPIDESISLCVMSIYSRLIPTGV